MQPHLPMPKTRFLPPGIPRAQSAQELLEIAKGTAIALFNHLGGIEPTFMFDNPPGQYTSAMQVLWQNATEKHMVAHTMRKMFEALGLTRYAVITEIWWSEVRATGTLAEAMNSAPRPSKDPNRKEGIIIIVHDGPDITLSAMFEIHRPAGAKPHLTEVSQKGASQFVDMTFAPVPKTKN